MDTKQVLDSLVSNLFSHYTVKDIVAHPLSSNGQYFSSYILKVKAVLENDNCESQLDLIIKILPSQENDIETNSKLKFKKEIEFYRHTMPEYNKIQGYNDSPEQTLFPLFYNATDEAIALQDLHSEGYHIYENLLTEVQCKIVLKELAKFHATGIAMKLTKPKMFEEMLSSVMIPALRHASNPDREEINMKFRSEIKTLLLSNYAIKDLADDVDDILCKIDNSKLPTPKEPFSTLLHNDLWRGNIMFKKSSSSGQPFFVKFIDFQTVIFNSPARDLVYFLFSSVEVDVLDRFLELMKFYHSNLVKDLSCFGVNPSMFTFDEFMVEVNCYGPTKLKTLAAAF